MNILRLLLNLFETPEIAVSVIGVMIVLILIFRDINAVAKVVVKVVLSYAILMALIKLM